MTPTAITISEDRVQAIWSYVRQHANSLDSERATNMIRALVQSAVSDVNELLAEKTAEVVKLIAELHELKLAHTRKKGAVKKASKHVTEVQA